MSYLLITALQKKKKVTRKLEKRMLSRKGYFRSFQGALGAAEGPLQRFQEHLFKTSSERNRKPSYLSSGCQVWTVTGAKHL